MARFIDRVGVIASNGFFQEVLGANGSRANASISPAGMTAILPLVGGTNAYTVQLPPGALVVDYVITVTTAFNGTTPTLTVGSSAAGSNMLAAQSISATGSAGPGCPAPAASTTGLVYVTLSGASSTGAGYLFINFVAKPVALSV